MKNKDIDKIIKEWGSTLRDLANCIHCAKCGISVYGEKFNLGSKYHSFEGCKKCAEEESNEKRKVP